MTVGTWTDGWPPGLQVRGFLHREGVSAVTFRVCLSPTGLLDDAKLPIGEFPVHDVGSIPLAEQHLGGVGPVGHEEAPGPSPTAPAPGRATCARQGIGKGRNPVALGCASLRAPGNPLEVFRVHSDPLNRWLWQGVCRVSN